MFKRYRKNLMYRAFYGGRVSWWQAWLVRYEVARRTRILRAQTDTVHQP